MCLRYKRNPLYHYDVCTTVYLHWCSKIELANIVLVFQNASDTYSDDVVTQSPVSLELEGPEDESQLQKEQSVERQQKTALSQSNGG